MIDNNDFTMMFKVPKKQEQMTKKDVLDLVIDALEEKKYNIVNQLTGYLTSGDPTYITSHNDARSIVTKYEREDLLEIIIADYLKNRKK